VSTFSGNVITSLEPRRSSSDSIHSLGIKDNFLACFALATGQKSSWAMFIIVWKVENNSALIKRHLNFLNLRDSSPRRLASNEEF
jgi:hypothetical protein